MPGTKSGAESLPNRRLSDALAMVDTPEGRARVKAYLAGLPFPHFEAYSENPRLLVRIDEDGARTVGHFVERQFIPDEPGARDL